MVQGGGTGATTFTAHGVLLGEGTSAIVATTAGTNGQILLGSTGADPSFVTPTAGAGLSVTANATTLSYALQAPVPVSSGGTGDTSFANTYGVICAGTTTTGALQVTASPSTAGQGLVSAGASSVPTWQNVFPGYTSGGNFAYAGTTSTLGSAPARTVIISPTAPGSILSAATDNVGIDIKH